MLNIKNGQDSTLVLVIMHAIYMFNQGSQRLLAGLMTQLTMIWMHCSY